MATMGSFRHHPGPQVSLLKTADPPHTQEAGRWYTEVVFGCRGCGKPYQCCMGFIPWGKLEPAQSAAHREEAWQWMVTQRSRDSGLSGYCGRSDPPPPAWLAR